MSARRVIPTHCCSTGRESVDERARRGNCAHRPPPGESPFNGARDTVSIDTISIDLCLLRLFMQVLRPLRGTLPSQGLRAPDAIASGADQDAKDHGRFVSAMTSKTTM